MRSHGFNVTIGVLGIDAIPFAKPVALVVERTRVAVVEATTRPSAQFRRVMIHGADHEDRFASHVDCCSRCHTARCTGLSQADYGSAVGRSRLPKAVGRGVPRRKVFSQKTVNEPIASAHSL
jgi:hypothetical protein